MIYETRRERIAAEKLQQRGRRMRSMKVGVASFATFAGVSVAGIAPAHANHTVENGDTLSGIAAQNSGVTVSGLMEANGLSSHLIYPGQNLSFPGSSSSDSSATTTSSASGTHTVVSGDTLGKIAAQHGTSVSALMSENGLSSHWIYPGDQLTIPGAGSSARAPPTAQLQHLPPTPRAQAPLTTRAHPRRATPLRAARPTTPALTQATANASARPPTLLALRLQVLPGQPTWQTVAKHPTVSAQMVPVTCMTAQASPRPPWRRTARAFHAPRQPSTLLHRKSLQASYSPVTWYSTATVA